MRYNQKQLGSASKLVMRTDLVLHIYKEDNTTNSWDVGLLVSLFSLFVWSFLFYCFNGSCPEFVQALSQLARCSVLH